MSNSVLSAHSPKFNSALVTLDQVRNLPTPQALGPNHKPVAHASLVDAIHREVATRGYQVVKEQLALGKKGAALFGVVDLMPTVPAIAVSGERGMSFGFRNATDRSMAIKAVAGSRVFVCDNLSLSGDVFAIERKNTTGLDLGDAIAKGFDKFLAHTQVLDIQIARLQETTLTDGEAKQRIFDIFSARVVPIRLFDDIESFYFHPEDAMTDCQPRSLWGLHNAVTRAMKDLTPVRLFNASIALGRQFEMTSGLPVLDGDVTDVSE